MTYKLHSLATFRGRIGPTGQQVESWTIGVRFGDPIAPTVGWVNQSVADAIAANFSDFFTSQGFTNNVTFEECRVYDIDDTNHASTAPIIASIDPVAGGGAQYKPFQCSMVCTHVGAGLGAGRRGRVFLPPMGFPISSDGTVPEALCDQLAQDWAEFLTACNTSFGGNAICVISSGKGPGILRPIVEVRVGHVMDTHRSRRRSLPENASSSSVAVSP